MLQRQCIFFLNYQTEKKEDKNKGGRRGKQVLCLNQNKCFLDCRFLSMPLYGALIDLGEREAVRGWCWTRACALASHVEATEQTDGKYKLTLVLNR